jgi:FtsP/CotA-like multicopper oxidase with cupredoxin domain
VPGWSLAWTLRPAYARTGNSNHVAPTAARVPGGAARDVIMDLHIRRKTIDIVGGRAWRSRSTIPFPASSWNCGKATTPCCACTTIRMNPLPVYWHGILLPFTMDGVSGVAFPGIDPGGVFDRIFRCGSTVYLLVPQPHWRPGATWTVWYGPLVIHSRSREDYIPVDRDYVIVLSDWTFEAPHRVVARLKKMSDYYNFNKRTVENFVADVSKADWSTTLRDLLA